MAAEPAGATRARPLDAPGYEPFDRHRWRDPYGLYRRLRDDDPVHRSPNGFWVLSRFADVFAAARDTDVFSSARGLTFGNEREALGLKPTIVMMDPPDHTALRRLATRRFTPRSVTTVEPAVRAYVGRLVDELRDTEESDFVQALAAPVPAWVVAHYLGVPEADRHRFAGWTAAIVQGAAGGYGPVAGALAELYGYFSELVERRRTEPGDDLISALVGAGDALGVDDILGYAFVLVAGGNDTTAGLLAGTAALLTDHPDQRRALIGDPGRVPAAVEELLRVISPVQGLCRVATRPVDVRGVRIEAGDRVLLCYGAANRDPREFGDDAEQLRVDRRVDRHLAFSSGAHFCLGASAARLMGRVVIEELLDRCPRFVADGAAGTFADGHFTRRYETLPFHPTGL